MGVGVTLYTIFGALLIQKLEDRSGGNGTARVDADLAQHKDVRFKLQNGEYDEVWATESLRNCLRNGLLRVI